MANRHLILDPSAPHNLFPQQRETIERICHHIEEFPTTSGSGQLREQFSVNHVIALLGDRGSGKTTTLFQTRQRLAEIGPEKKILPTDLFVPDVLHTGDAIGPAVIKILGDALIGYAEQAGGEHVEFIKERFALMADDLTWFYNNSVPNDILARDSVSSKQFSRKMFDYHQRSLTLPQRFSADVEQITLKLGLERLIFFADDADINIELVEGILDFIRYFLSTPKVITVLGADIDTLRRRLFNKHLKGLQVEKFPEGSGFKIFGASGEDYKAREIEQERDYVDAFLTKLLPPATRVHMPLIDSEILFRHEVSFGEGPTETAERLLSKIKFSSTLEDSDVRMSDLVERYPGVLESNLRAFINQFSTLVEIVNNYEDQNYEFFGLDEKLEAVNVAGGALNLDGSLSNLDQAALLRVLRVFLSSTVHANWREAWAYFGIIDVLKELSLSKLLNVVVMRLTANGTAIDTLTYRLSGKEYQSTKMSRKEEVHVFNLIIDIALHFGANCGEVLRYLNLVPSEAFRYFYLTDPMSRYLEESAGDISDNITIIHGAHQKGVSALFTPEVDGDSIQPVYLTCARDIAVHFHTTTQRAVLERIENTNTAFQEKINDEHVTDAQLVRAELSQIYAIFYYAMKTCVDQVSSVYLIINERDAADLTTVVEFRFSTNTQIEWGIVDMLSGWRFFKRVFDEALVEGSDSQDWDAIFMIFLHIAQLPYEFLVSCFSDSDQERKAQKAVEQKCDEMLDFMTAQGFIRDGAFVDGPEFRRVAASIPNMLRLKKSLKIWPDVDFGRKGQRLVRFLNYLKSGPETLPPDFNIRANPPPAWQRWAEEMGTVCRQDAKERKPKEKSKKSEERE